MTPDVGDSVRRGHNVLELSLAGLVSPYAKNSHSLHCVGHARSRTMRLYLINPANPVAFIKATEIHWNQYRSGNPGPFVISALPRGLGITGSTKTSACPTPEMPARTWWVLPPSLHRQPPSRGDVFRRLAYPDHGRIHATCPGRGPSKAYAIVTGSGKHLFDGWQIRAGHLKRVYDGTRGGGDTSSRPARAAAARGISSARSRHARLPTQFTSAASRRSTGALPSPPYRERHARMKRVVRSNCSS